MAFNKIILKNASNAIVLLLSSCFAYTVISFWFLLMKVLKHLLVDGEEREN